MAKTYAKMIVSCIFVYLACFIKLVLEMLFWGNTYKFYIGLAILFHGENFTKTFEKDVVPYSNIYTSELDHSA